MFWIELGKGYSAARDKLLSSERKVQIAIEEKESKQ